MGDALPPGSRLAIDIGTVRIGVARAAAGTTLAVPVETVAAGPSAMTRILDLINEIRPAVVYVGDPLRLDGTVGPAAVAARDFARSLAGHLPASADSSDPSVTVGCKVHIVDERLSTAQSGRQLQDAGRRTRSARAVIDQAAAVVILQDALQREHTTGRLAGRRVEQDDR